MIVLLPSSDKGRRIDMVIEVKDNETLRALKAPKKTKCKGIVTECIKDNFNALSTSVSSIGIKKQQTHLWIWQEAWSMIKKISISSATRVLILPKNILEWQLLKTGKCLLCNRWSSFNLLTAAHVILDSDSKHQTREAVNSTLAKSETVSYIHSEAKVHKTVSSAGLFV